MTEFWRALGDQTSRLDRTEPRSISPDGDKDTTTPVAMLGNLKTILLGDALSAVVAQRLMDWLAANTTGRRGCAPACPRLAGGRQDRHRRRATRWPTIIAIVTPPGPQAHPGRAPIPMAATARRADREAVLRCRSAAIVSRASRQTPGRVQRDLGLQQLGHRAAGFGLGRQFLEFGVVGAGNFRLAGSGEPW